MAGKAINQYNEFTGNASAVNILVQETSQSDPNTFEHKKANLSTLIQTVASVDDVVEGYYYNGAFYEESTHATVMSAVTGRIYIDLGATPTELYRYNGSAYATVTDNALRSALSGGTVTVDKANKDGDGNVIKTTYATKAELTTEQNARQASDDNLQSQIVNINGDIDNIEALIGEEAEVENTDPSSGTLLAQSRLIHHANLLPNGEFGRVGARSVPFNQKIQNGNFESQSVWSMVNGSYSVANNVATVTMSNTTGNLQQTLSLISGHTYIFCCDVKASNSTMQLRISNAYGGDDVFAQKNTNWQKLITKWAGNFTGNLTYPNIYANGTTSGDTFQARNVMLFDLTTMNMASLTAGEFRSLFPASYYPHTLGSMYDLNPSGFRIDPINIFDGMVESGDINIVDGTERADATRMRGENFMEVSPATTYYGLSSYPNTTICCYDKDKNWVSSEYQEGYFAGGNVAFTTPSWCYFIKVYFNGTSYTNPIQICRDNLPSSVKTTFHQHEASTTILTPQISDGHYVNDSCYDYVENVVEGEIVKGKKHTVVGSYTFDGTENWQSYSDGFILVINDLKIISADNPPNIICAGYSTANIYSSSDMIVAQLNWDKYIFIRNSSFASVADCQTGMAGKTINYELATETITDCEPLRSFNISDYSTVEPITPQEQLANRIDVPFSVKTKSANTLIAQIRQNAADIATHTAQISNHEARIQNLEQEHGGYVEINYRGTNAVPTGKADYALVDKIVGKTRAWNCGAKYSVVNPNGIVDGVAYIFTKGHSYIIVSTNPLPAYCYCQTDQVQGIAVISAGSSYTVGTANSSFNSGGFFNNYSGTTITFSTEIFIRDLTLIFPELPSSAFTTGNVPQLVKLCPDLLKPDANTGYSLPSTTVSGVESVGVNIWNERWELGALSLSTGADSPSSTAIRSKDYIPMEYGKEYYVLSPNTTDGLYACIYDGNKNFIRARLFNTPNGLTIEPTSQEKYMRFYTAYTATSYSGMASDGIQICDNTYPNKTTYHPYMTDTLSLPTPVTLRSAGSVADADELNVEVLVDGVKVNKRRQTSKVGSYTFTGNETWGYNSSKHLFYSSCIASEVYVPTDVYAKSNVVFPLYQSDGIIYLHVNANDKTIAIGTSDYYGAGFIVIYDTSYDDTTMAQFKSNLTGKTINFELATESVTLLNPIENNTLLTEGGGTINTIQTQTPVIDNSMDVGYLAL